MKRLVAFALALVILLVSSPAYAGGSVSTYSDFNCTVPAGTFTSGQTVHGGGTFSGSAPYSVEYFQPSGALVQTDSGFSGSTFCDSVGYSVKAGDPSGTWTVEVIDKHGGVSSSVTFAVLAATPEFPLGVLPLIGFVLLAYFLIRRKQGLKGPQAQRPGL